MKSHLRRKERICRYPVRSTTEDPDVVDFEQESLPWLIDERLFNYADAAESDSFCLRIDDLASLWRVRVNYISCLNCRYSQYRRLRLRCYKVVAFRNEQGTRVQALH